MCAVESSQLARFPLLQGMEEEWLDALANKAQRRSYKAGELIFEEGKPGAEIHFILEGRVKISRRIREKEQQGLSVLQEGMFFGGVSWIDGRGHSASVIAASDVTTIVIGAAEFETYIENNALGGIRLMRDIIGALCEHLRGIDDKFIDMVQYIKNK